MSDCGTTCTRVKVIITLINNSLNAICYTWLNRILIQYKLTQLNWHSALAYSWLNLSFFDHSWLNVFEATHQRRASSEAYHHSAVMNIRHTERWQSSLISINVWLNYKVPLAPLALGFCEYNDASGLQTYALPRAPGSILFLKTMLYVLSLWESSRSAWPPQFLSRPAEKQPCCFFEKGTHIKKIIII